MYNFINFLKKFICIIIVTFLSLQFFTIVPLRSEETNEDNNTQVSETIDDDSSNDDFESIDEDVEVVNSDNQDTSQDEDNQDDTDIVDENSDEEIIESDEDIEISVDNDEENVVEVNYPEFLQKQIVDDVIINVYAPEGVFPEESHLYVQKVELVQEISDVLDEVRDENKNVVESHTFDIKVLNELDEEIQPNDGSKVKVSFSMQQVTNNNLQTDVYHIDDIEPSELTVENVEVLQVVTDGDEAIVETESFSFYTVEFTYRNLEYILLGDTSIKLSILLDKLGLSGNIENVEVSNSSLFDVIQEDGEYIVIAKQAFDTEEWMKVTIDGIEYIIVVTDSVGSIDLSNIPITDISIDYDKLLVKPEIIVYSDSSSSLIYTLEEGINPTDSSIHYQLDSGYIRLRNVNDPIWGTTSDTSWGFRNKHEFLSTNIITMRYKDAAIYKDGSKMDVLITINDINHYRNNNGNRNNHKPTIVNYGSNGPNISGYAISDDSTGYYYGLVEDVTIQIVDTGAASTTIDSSFILGIDGVDWQGYSSANIKDASSHQNFKEQFEIKSGSISELTDDSTNPTAYAILAKVSGLKATATTSGYRFDEPHNMRLFAKASHSLTASTGPNGRIDLWDDGLTYLKDSDAPLGVNKIMNGVKSTDGKFTFSVPDGKVVTYKFIPDDGYSLRTLTLNGSQVNATPRDANDNIVTPRNAVYYTYTLPASHKNDSELYVEWFKPALQEECIDCKNFDACQNCYLSYAGGAISNYEKVVDGAQRGGDAYSNLGSYVLGGDDTFAKPLPYGNVFVDVTKLNWSASNIDNITIDIKDPRFKIVGPAGTALSTHSEYRVVRQSTSSRVPTIAYYGPIHSYLMYGDEKDSLARTGYLGKDVDSDGVAAAAYPRDNRPASSDIVASGTYQIYETINGTKEKYTVELVNGTMVIKPAANSSVDYLYRVTYKDAVVLLDGSRGNLVLTTKKVEIESSYTSERNVYVGLQKANEMTVFSGYEDNNGVRYIPNQETVTGVTIGSSSTPTVDGNASRNTIGEKVTFEVKATRPDGTVVDGIITYGVKDLDWQSFESAWGRQPKDTYSGNGGTATVTTTQNAWRGTHEFYEYGEGLAINSGAKSYALLAGYAHDASPYNYNAGSLPINELLRTQKTNDGLSKLTLYDAPLQARPINKQPGDYTANGLHFVTTSAMKFRNNDGVFTQTVMTGFFNAGLFSPDGYQKYSSMRSDEKTFDSGFAVLLDAAGSELTWTGSYHVNDGINTDLFDSRFASYLTLSHGTGGGIYVEDYNFEDKCTPIYRENMVTMGSGADVKTTIVPEDGYRVNRIMLDDIEITINYDDNDNPVSATFEYGNGVIDPPINFVGGKCVPQSIINAQYNESGIPLTSYNLILTANDDGIIDVDIFNREYKDLDNNNIPDTSRHNIHADFDTFYYFTKVWADAGSYPEDKPTSLTFTASPYVFEQDKVVVNGVEYDITHTRTMHLDVIDDEGRKYNNSNVRYPKFDIHTALDQGAILLTISGNRQVYPTFTIDADADSIPETKYVLIGDLCYTVNASGDDIDTSIHPKSGNNYTNGFKIIRLEDDYEVNLPGKPEIVAASTMHPGFTTYVLHHVTEITYEGGGSTYKTTNNPEYKSDGTNSDIVYVTIGRRSQKPYSKIKIGDDHYAITGNSLHKIIKNSSNEWQEDGSISIPISREFERYNDGTYINKKTFTLDISDPNQRKYITESDINNGQDLLWKIKYPAQGVDFDNDGIKEWPALAIETEHIYDDMHEINTDHVERLYWFVNERLGSLDDKWALEGYTNDATYVDDKYQSNSEAPGYMSYRDYRGNIKYTTTYFYLLATEDKEEVLKELGEMAKLRMAFMSPISSETVRRSSYADTYGKTYYDNWGGMVVNAIHQSKLRVNKNWIGGDNSDRTPFKMTIHREYTYKQDSHSTATVGNTKTVTLPKGSDFNDILIKLAGGNALAIKRFRNGSEPLTSNKNAAIVLQDDGSGGLANLAQVDDKKLVKIPYNTFNYFNGTKQAESKEASVYLWFDDIDDGTIYMWSDADEVFLAEDASGMFKGFDNLEQISGVYILNTSQTKNMENMFAASTSGKIADLYNLREWDTSNVESFKGFLKNQNSLEHIHGIVDFNLQKANDFTDFIGTASTSSKTDWSRYDGNNTNTKTHLFIWYPNVYIDNNGNVVTHEGQPLNISYSQSSNGSVQELHWDSKDLANMDSWWNNGINTPTNFTDPSLNTTWQWNIQDKNMAYSDADKWSYRLYETEYGKDYINSDSATNLANSKEFIYNDNTGLWEAELTNVKTTSINIQKKTIDNEEGEFKFRVKFESLYEPEDKIEDATKNTIVVALRFEDKDGVYLDLSENRNDYVYVGEPFRLTLYGQGTGTNPSSYSNTPIESKVFPEGWKKNTNGTWSYTFENIDDQNIHGYLVGQTANTSFRYKGNTELSTFMASTTTKEISQDEKNLNYHTTLLTSKSTIGDKSDIQRSTLDELKEKINVDYQRGDGLKKIRYEVWDGQQYEIYDVIIGVDSQGNTKYNPDGSIQNFAVYYGGVEKNINVASTSYPYYIYTDAATGSIEYDSVLNYATYDAASQTTVFVGSKGLHTLNKDNHILKVVENVNASNMTFQEASNTSIYPNLPLTTYIFIDPIDSKIKYQHDGTSWKKYNDGNLDATWTGPVPPDATSDINTNRMQEVWGTKYPNVRHVRAGYPQESDYQVSGTYKVIDPATGTLEEYHIIEQSDVVVSITHKTTDGNVTTETTIDNIVSNKEFKENSGEYEFETTNGKRYIFSGTEIIIVPNIWEFTLRNDEDFTINKIPLGTSYEIWEYDLNEDWALIKREEKKYDSSSTDPWVNVSSSTASLYEGDDNLETVKKYSKVFEENASGPYYQLKKGNYTQTQPNANNIFEYETYSNDISILKVYEKIGNAYVANNNATTKYYKLIYTKVAPLATTANDYVGYDGTNLSSIKKYKFDFVESYNGTYYKKKDGTYDNIMPIDQSHLTSTGNGGVKRFIGNSDIVRHIFTNQKDTLSLTIDKTVKGNQGSKDQYFKFNVEVKGLKENYSVLTIDDVNSKITTSFQFVLDSSGTYWRYKDGRYTKTEPTFATADIYVGYDGSDITSCTRYKAIKPNFATEFFNYDMQNANNRDDRNAQRVEPVGDFLTFKEALNNPDLNEKELTFEIENQAFLNHSTKYIYDKNNNTWVKYTWQYVNNAAGTYYLNTTNNTYGETNPSKNDIANYEGFDSNNLKNKLKTYDASGNPDDNGNYYNYNGTYELYNDSHLMDYEDAYQLALDMLTKYKPGYIGEDITNVPDDAISKGIAGRQIVANNGEVSFVVYLKHGESIKIDGFNKGATFTINEVIDGIEDYKTTITDSNGEQEIVSKLISGEFGKNVEESASGQFYKLQDGSGYERPSKYYADYMTNEDINNLPKYKKVYLQRSTGSYYRLIDSTYTKTAPTVQTKHIYEDYDPNSDDFSKYRKYKVDYVKDSNGTYYKVVSSSSNIEDRYKQEAPSTRYDLSKKYILNVTSKYTNTKDGIVPTKAFAGYFTPLIIMNFIALCYILYERRRYRNREPDE